MAADAFCAYLLPSDSPRVLTHVGRFRYLFPSASAIVYNPAVALQKIGMVGLRFLRYGTKPYTDNVIGIGSGLSTQIMQLIPNNMVDMKRVSTVAASQSATISFAMQVSLDNAADTDQHA